MNDDQTERMTAPSLDVRAADGGLVRGAANNAGDFLNMLEDGQLGADLHRDIGKLAETMNDMCIATGKKQKGRVTITIDLMTDQISGGSMFMATGKYAVKAPEEKRKPTMLFTDDRNQFTRSQPRHGQFFGVRDIDAAPGSVRQI